MVVAGVGLFMILLYVGSFIFIVGALIYFIKKRIKDKKEEDFEKRNN
jgi:uncharacterized BrkB/YihY/UPF0761 family membrane protein